LSARTADSSAAGNALAGRLPRTKKPALPKAQAFSLPEILGVLRRTYPEAHCELHHENAFQLLVATILSAQCTDRRVNQVTPALFARFPDAPSLAKADPLEVESLIRSTGFYHNKTRNLIACAQALVLRHDGLVPSAMTDLVALPGVGRKTANVVLGTAFGISSGIVVDTHVARLSRRLGLTGQTDPAKIEQDLVKKVPSADWIALSHWLIWHGRRRCAARRPDCAGCELYSLCPTGRQQVQTP
jgi:endonuclease-3